MVESCRLLGTLSANASHQFLGSYFTLMMTSDKYTLFNLMALRIRHCPIHNLIFCRSRMNLFLRRRVRLSLFVGWMALHMFSAARVKGTGRDPLEDTQKFRCPYPGAEDSVALCRRCAETHVAAAVEKGSLGECCATAAVQERCQRMTSLRSTGDGDDDYHEDYHKGSQWPGEDSSKFLVSRRRMILFAKRPRNTFLGKRMSASESFEKAYGGVDSDSGNRRSSSEKRPNRNKFLGRRSVRASSWSGALDLKPDTSNVTLTTGDVRGRSKYPLLYFIE